MEKILMLDMLSNRKQLAKVISQNRGFTLIELMIIVVIIAILATIAYPSYQSNVRKAKRNDAIEALLRIQLAQEKWRVNDTDYATLVELGNPSTADDFYTISIPVNTASGYTIRATAVGDQLNDSEGGATCSPMELVVSAGGETKTPSACW